jgi:hypothetical protein
LSREGIFFYITLIGRVRKGVCKERKRNGEQNFNAGKKTQPPETYPDAALRESGAVGHYEK